MFCLLSVSCLVVELFIPIHTTVMLTVCHIKRQPGRGHHYSHTNACGESAATKKIAETLTWCAINRGSHMNVHELLNLLIGSGKRDKMQG